mgnify:CR=1 FL=1
MKNRKEWPWWEDIRYYGFGDFTKLNAIIITHDKDNYNSPNDYSLLKKSNNVEFVDISDSKCKKKNTLGGYHGLALTKCYADEEKKEIHKLMFCDKDDECAYNSEEEYDFEQDIMEANEWSMDDTIYEIMSGFELEQTS